jgi:hypothetical protein
MRRLSEEMFLRALSRRGIPRYLDRRELRVKPKIFTMWSCIGIEVLKKKIWDLSLLISIPEASQKF